MLSCTVLPLLAKVPVMLRETREGVKTPPAVFISMTPVIRGL